MKVQVKLFTMLALVALTLGSQAQATTASEFYTQQEIEEFRSGDLSNQDLKDYLRRIEQKKFRPLSYSKEMKRIFFGSIHLNQDSRGYFIEDVYCNSTFRSPQIGPNKIPSNRQINVEHVWPQSKGSKKHPAKSDMHHLLPTDSVANSVRGNLIFAEVDGRAPKSDCKSSLVGDVYDPNSPATLNEQGFEPSDEIKGDVARAMFYVSIQYGYKIDRVEEAYLRKWHREDPPGSEEIYRNTLVAEAQGNRNVFIDFADLADRIADF